MRLLVNRLRFEVTSCVAEILDQKAVAAARNLRLPRVGSTKLHRLRRAVIGH
jgi:hypothetical protein